ncbi:MAG: EF-P lysine aminoacylase EpmA [Hyphomicrobiaceae bacterium]
MTVNADQTPWWDKGRHSDRRGFLLTRAAIKTALQGWFAGEAFIEVEPGCLQVSPGNEAHLHAFATERIGTDLSRTPLYLHTSPEFAMKKLLAAGEERICAFAPVFRNREAGGLHANEFTMLEWYRAGTGYDAMMADCGALLALAAETAGTKWVSYRGGTCDPRVVPERVTVGEAFARHAGIDLFATIGNRDWLARAADAQGVRVGADYSWADIFARVLTERIEPRLGVGRATLLCDYPASEAALAKRSERDPRVAERFELYVCGVEVANGFSELTDAQVQRANLEAEMQLKQERYGERYPIDEDFLRAVAAMPQASGCAMGFDRLVMLAAGAERVEQVIWTPLST